jgi:aspartyl-tRNA(Asn)/glutamyl-tRNA(Gln) amidotransferase subunit A
LTVKSAVELSALIRGGEVTPSEVAEAFLARHEETKHLNAFITLDGDAVLKRAKELDAAAITPGTHPLFGLPVAVKDNIATKDFPTTCASKMLENFRPPYDAEVVSRLRNAGAVILGKTNMDEFAMGSSGASSYFGAVKNPRPEPSGAIGPGVSPGGSSSGSAAAVAACSTPLALGSDTGGSVRLPAAYCGIVGYKPSYGTVSRDGLFAYAGSFDQIGPLARTVADAALLAGAIMDRPLSLNTQFNAKGRKVGVLKEFPCVDRAVEIYKALGAEIVEISVPLIEYALPIYRIIACCEASSAFAVYDGVRFGGGPPRTVAADAAGREDGLSEIDRLYINARTEGFGAEVRRRIWLGTYMLSAGKYEQYYKKARVAGAMMREAFDGAFGRCDVLLSPVSLTGPPCLGEKQYNRADCCTVPANICGLPAIAVGNTQLMGKRFDDADLLGFAHVLEQNGGGVQ